MKIFDKLYVGLTKERYAQTDEQRILGFAIGMDSTAAFKKRKETVDRWKQKDLEALIIDNKPLFGFKIVDTVSRWSTSNKLFRVLDPRGFELEISTDNLFSIMMNTTIVNAQIMEPMLWMGKTLIRESSSEYQNHINPNKAMSITSSAGQFYFHPATDKVVYRYEGKFHYIAAHKKINRYDPNEYSRNSSYYYKHFEHKPTHLLQGRGGIQNYVKYDVKIQNKEPFETYSVFYIDGDDNISTAYIALRKSKYKDLVFSSDQNKFSKQFSEYKIPLDEYISSALEKNYNYIEKNHNVVYSYSSKNSRALDHMLFSSKEKRNDYETTITELNTIFHPTIVTTYERVANSYGYVDQDISNKEGFFYELFVDGELKEKIE